MKPDERLIKPKMCPECKDYFRVWEKVCPMCDCFLEVRSGL